MGKILVRLCISLLFSNYLFQKNCQAFEIVSSAVTFAVLSSLYAGWQYRCNFFECCDKKWIKNDLTGLVHDFQGKLHGQHLVSDIVLKALKNHLSNEYPSKALVLSFHGRTGSGKNHVANLVVNRIFKLGFNSESVNLWNSRMHFPHDRLINLYQTQVKSGVSQRVKNCPRSIFIFDEADLIPKGVIDTLKPLMDRHVEIDGVDFRKATFLFLSNTGGDDIAKIAETYFEQNKKREEITMQEIYPLIKGGSFKEKDYSLYSQDSAIDLVDYYVPFLPLEEKHVVLCIEDFLTHHKCKITDKFARTAAYNMEYDSVHLFSRTGCKKVDAEVNVILQDECD